MDPLTCYRELVEALQTGALEEATTHAGNLWRWLERGGFCPDEIPPVLRRSGWLRQLASMLSAIADSVEAQRQPHQ